MSATTRSLAKKRLHTSISAHPTKVLPVKFSDACEDHSSSRHVQTHGKRFRGKENLKEASTPEIAIKQNWGEENAWTNLDQALAKEDFNDLLHQW